MISGEAFPSGLRGQWKSRISAIQNIYLEPIFTFKFQETFLLLINNKLNPKLSWRVQQTTSIGGQIKCRNRKEAQVGAFTRSCRYNVRHVIIPIRLCSENLSEIKFYEVEILN